MKKLFGIIQVIVLIGVLIYIVLDILKPSPQIDYHPENWNSWDGFYALSYAGVTKKEGTIYVSQKRLKEHLIALKNAGFKTIKPEDVVNFLEGKSPLPEKAVLIIFEGGRKDSYLYTMPLLKKLGMTASMCVPTQKLYDGGSFYLSEKELGKIAKQQYWTLCSMGHSALSEIKTNDSDKKGHFLTSRMWRDERIETPAEFVKRVENDYKRSAEILEKIGKRPVSMYLYPFADIGRGHGAYELAEEINQKAVTEYYKIAFTTSNQPFNSIYANPYRLNRLRVQNDWNGDELIEHIMIFQPKNKPYTELEDLKSWSITGEIKQKDRSLILSPNSIMWLHGSEYWSDIEVKAELLLDRDAYVLFYIRADDMDAYIRLTLENDRITLSEKLDKISQTLIRERVEKNNRHILHIRVKNNRVWIENNGKLIKFPIPISEYINRGNFGIGCLNGYVKLASLNVTPIPKYYVFAESFSALPPTIQQKISVMLPTWFSFDEIPKLSAKQIRDVLIAKSSGVKIIPVIKVTSDLSNDKVKVFVNKLTHVLRESIVKTLIDSIGIYGLDNNLSIELEVNGYKLVRILTPAEVLNAAWEKVNVKDDLIIINGKGKELRESFEKIKKFIPINRIIIRDEDVSEKISIELARLVDIK